MRGGVCLSNDQTVFSFELDESLYFERGQEVEEIVGISLDPEISIQAFNEYISIRGVVELQGEYQKLATTIENDDDETYFDNYHAKRFIEKVTNTENGLAKFTHRFPVEISVPTYRVKDLDDVTVSIASFDYEIPEQNQLRLKSMIEIHGISDQIEEADLSDENKVDEELVTRAKEEIEESFEFDIKESNEEVDQEIDIIKSREEQKEKIPEDVQRESSEDDRWKLTKSQTLAEFFQKDEEKESHSVASDSSITENFYESFESENISADFVNSESSLSRSKEEVADLRYLAGMFNEEEERYTKMRLCIVQEKDTLETIADRYKTTTFQIVNQNRLEDDTVVEGQLLYIPFKKKE